jgi:hypothetical protein
VNRQRAFLDEGPGPHLIEQFLSGHEPARVPDEMDQNVERLRRKGNRPRALREAALRDVERQIAEQISLSHGYNRWNLGES